MSITLFSCFGCRSVTKEKQPVEEQKANRDILPNEIRVYYSKGIATPTHIYTHVEPAGLVEELGEYLERADPMQDKQPGGSNHYSYRWRAIKPGTVTVWLEELMPSYESDSLSQDYAPYACFEIDENLKVKQLNRRH